MFFNNLKSKLNIFAHNSKNLIISEVFGSFSDIISIFCYSHYNKDTIVICKTIEEAKNLFDLAKNVFNIKNVFYFPDFNLEPYTSATSSKNIKQIRIDTLYGLINNKDPKLLITTMLASIYYTAPKEYLKNNQLNISISQEISIHSVINFLIKYGYVKKDKVIYQGEFAVRGDIIDVYSANNKLPVRISFFGDSIESIKTFDVANQVTNDKLNNTLITVPLEISLNSETRDNFKHNYYDVFQKDIQNIQDSDLSDIDSILDDNMILGTEFYLPLFFNKTDTIFHYLDNPIVIFNKTSLLDIDSFWQLYHDSYTSRVNSNTFSINKYNLLSPSKLLLGKKEVQKLLNTLRNIEINSNSYPENEKIKDKEIISVHSKSMNFLIKKDADINIKGNLLIQYIIQNKGKKFVINLLKQDSLKFITHLLKENNLHYKIVKNPNKVANNDILGSEIILTNINAILEGFSLNNYIFICEQDIFGQHTVINSNIRPKKVKNFGSLKELKPGDLLVHLKHGIGKFVGLINIDTQGVLHDFLVLEYSQGDKLYLPVENIDLLSKYGSNSDSVVLDKLGSNNWDKRKSAIKEKLHDIAYDLIKLAAVRNLKIGPKIDPNPEHFFEFNSAFPYIETEDQLKAIEDIRNDFANNQVIDRLICGDVGFGKTEVAMRAAFLAVSSGYQVVVIAPTTLLVRQHYQNFLNRFKKFPFIIKQLSRFVLNKEKAIIKEDLKQGKVDIIIATHALLSKDIGFSKLGLLIIDEEQNFGVIHKEKIKTLKENIHTINLTATPIPRTLQMALSGVKSLSIIATPPVDKLPIKTYVLPFDEIIIKEAILREVNRHGQVFFVTPFISELEIIESFLNNLKLPIKTLILHGKMQNEQIENHMKDFQDNKYNVLLSTNIIESGIDLNNVNTIIIKNADMFGLAQLYQLRGRVGRGKKQSYAYITYKGVNLLTPDAKKRLDAIQNLDYLGAGFTLAEHDLDIRGAGNILGKEQSGHVKGLGIDLYNKFLTEEINKLKLKGDTVPVTYDSLSPDIILPLPSLIPSSYISNMSVRLEFYQLLGNASSFTELNNISNDLIDRFGKIPIETENLLDLIKIKILSRSLRIEKLAAGSKGATVKFYENKPLNTDILLGYIKHNSKTIKIQKDLSLILVFNSSDKKENVKEILTFLFTLRNLFNVE